jgi:hypothetical protein
MNMRILISMMLVFYGSFLMAQDTLKVKRPDDDRFCTLLICVKKDCWSDSIPTNILSLDNKIELRINDKCNAKKKADVFVKSFEVWTETNGQKNFENAQSSFFTDPQLKIIRKLKKGDAFEVKNVLVHGPDGFRKMDNIKIILK